MGGGVTKRGEQGERTKEGGGKAVLGHREMYGKKGEPEGCISVDLMTGRIRSKTFFYRSMYQASICLTRHETPADVSTIQVHGPAHKEEDT